MIFLILFTCGADIYSQTNAPATAPIMALARTDTNGIFLRWVIGDFTAWQAANQHGYTIKRVTYARDTVLSMVDQVQSLKTLEADFRPLTGSEWSGLFPGNELADAASKLLYSSEWEVSISGGATFAEAVEAYQANENRLFFAQVIADRDQRIAKGLALGFTDESAIPGETYFYSIIINDGNPDHIGSAVGELGTSGTEQLPVPQDLTVENKDHKITIGWSVTGLEEVYTSYDILRSTDGVEFAPVNTSPFIYGGEDNEDPYAYFTDTLEQNGVYFYKVAGKTPFGILGPASTSVAGQARPERLMSFQLFFDSQATPDTNQLFLGWEQLPAGYSDTLTGFNIYRSISIEGPFELLTATALPDTTRGYLMSDPPEVAYYVLEAEDFNGHIYQSPPKFAQVADLMAPAVPAGLIGKADENEMVQLSWQANAEEDLAGYRLYRCLLRGGTFAEVTNGVVQELEFADNIAGTIVNDTVYYQIQAYDQVGNASPFSAVLAVPRVDVTPPAKPILTKALPTPKGVALGWQYSGSADAGAHELRRKAANGPNWETLLVIPVESREMYHVVESNDQVTGTSYIDPGPLDRQEYQYQLLAIDDNGNAAGSEVLTVRPYDSGERGSIDKLGITGGCQDLPEGQVCSITINWDYQMDATVTGFQVHRSRKGSNIRLYKVLRTEVFFPGGNVPNGTQSFTFTDTDVDPGVRYVYQLMAQHIDGGFSKVSGTVTAVAN